MKNKASDWFSTEEIRQLTARSDVRGLAALLGAWLPAILAISLYLQYPGVLSFVLASLIAGSRQMALAVLMHESAHRSLAASPRLNDFLGQWLAAGPIVQNMALYRVHHRRHHRRTGTTEDPDLALATGFPVKRASMRRKVLRDICGLTGVRSLYGSLAMLSGHAIYDVSGNYRLADQNGRGAGERLRIAASGLAPFLCSAMLATALLTATGHLQILAIWMAGYLFVFPLLLRIRSLAEHAMTRDPDDALNSARTTTANFWERMLFAPLNVNYHLEHHMLPGAPYFRLPQIHRMLEARGAFAGPVALSASYAQVLAEASSA